MKLYADPSSRELLNLISFKTEGLLELHDQIPLPFADPSEPGSFYFVSEVSMRKLFAELLKTISYQSEYMLLQDTAGTGSLIIVSWSKHPSSCCSCCPQAATE